MKNTNFIKAAAIVAAFILLLKAVFKVNVFAKMKNSILSLPQLTAEFLKPIEGFRAEPYGDYKQLSIGYGTKATGANDRVTKAEAEKRLIAHCKPLIDQVQAANLGLNASQVVGFVSFGYNLGSGTLATMLKRLRDGQKLDFVAASMRKYINAGGKPLTELAKRRQKETDLIEKKTSL